MMPDELRRDRERVRQSWADLLRPIGWSYFVTLSFHRPASRYGALAATRWWVSREAERGASAVFFAVERGGHGLWHVHLLVATTRTLTRTIVQREWGRGIPDVSPFDVDRGAAYYVAKFTFDDDAEYDIELFGSDRPAS